MRSKSHFTFFQNIIIIMCVRVCICGGEWALTSRGAPTWPAKLSQGIAKATAQPFDVRPPYPVLYWMLFKFLLGSLLSGLLFINVNMVKRLKDCAKKHCTFPNVTNHLKPELENQPIILMYSLSSQPSMQHTHLQCSILRLWPVWELHHCTSQVSRRGTKTGQKLPLVVTKWGLIWNRFQCKTSFAHLIFVFLSIGDRSCHWSGKERHQGTCFRCRPLESNVSWWHYFRLKMWLCNKYQSSGNQFLGNLFFSLFRETFLRDCGLWLEMCLLSDVGCVADIRAVQYIILISTIALWRSTVPYPPGLSLFFKTRKTLKYRLIFLTV